MATVPITITDAGLAEVVNAEKNGTAPVVLTTISIGTGQYTPKPDQTSMLAKFKDFDTISGGAAGDNVIHVSIQDDSIDSYTVYEIGVFTDSGTLFAVYSQNTPIIQKASAAHMLLAMDMVLTNVNPDSVAVGDMNFALNPATTTRQGIVELATSEEVASGTDGSRAVTPATMIARTATTGRTGLVELATNAETITGTDTARAVTPASMLAAFIREHGATGSQKIPGGFMMQWGKALIAPDGTTNIVFPATYLNKTVGAWAISADNVQPSFSVATLTNGSVNFKHNGNGGVLSFWFAIGY